MSQESTQARPGNFPHVIRVRVSEADRERLAEAAAVAGMRLGSYARHKLMGAHVSAKIDVQILNELRRQGGLAKKLAAEGQDTSAVLAEIIKTMRAVQASI